MRTKFQLSSFMATLMPFYVFIAFAIFSVPGSVLAARIGKKKVLLLGLGLTTLAVGVPVGCFACLLLLSLKSAKKSAACHPINP